MKNLEDRDEKYVKEQVKKLLKKYKAYYFMPVQSGFGSSCLDFIGTHKGRGYAIETKRPGKKMTPRQELVADEMRAAGTAVFLIGDDVLWEAGEDENGLGIRVAVAFTGMEALEGWLLFGP